MSFSKTWYVGTLHFLTAGIFFPLVVSLVCGGIFALFLAQDSVLMQVLSLVIWNIGIWLGVMYSAKFINKTFTGFTDAKIAREGVIYNILIAAVVTGYGIHLANTVPNAVFSYSGAGLFLVSAAISTILYYCLTLEYLKGK